MWTERRNDSGKLLIVVLRDRRFCVPLGKIGTEPCFQRVLRCCLVNKSEFHSCLRP